MLARLKGRDPDARLDPDLNDGAYLPENDQEKLASKRSQKELSRAWTTANVSMVLNVVLGRDIVSIEAVQTPRAVFEEFASRPKPPAAAPGFSALVQPFLRSFSDFAWFLAQPGSLKTSCTLSCSMPVSRVSVDGGWPAGSRMHGACHAGHARQRLDSLSGWLRSGAVR